MGDGDIVGNNEERKDDESKTPNFFNSADVKEWLVKLLVVSFFILGFFIIFVSIGLLFSKHVGAQEISTSTAVTTPSQVPASTVYAPSLLSGVDNCEKSTNVGGEMFGFGISFGSTSGDENCERRNYAVLLVHMGERAAALALLCQNQNVRDAMLSVGRSCPKTNASGIHAGKDHHRNHSVSVSTKGTIEHDR